MAFGKKKDKNSKEDNASGNDGNRFELAKQVVHYSFGVIVLLCVAITASYLGTDNDMIREAAKDLLNALLPMIGAWVGTVLAFYFTKDNFETASRSMSEMARQMTPTERLQATAVKDVMVKLNNMDYETIDGTSENDLKLAKLLEFLDRHGRTRLPILRKDQTPAHVIHRSMIDKYIAGRVLEAEMSKEQLDQLTLKQMLDDKEFNALATDSFATLDARATLADAKAKMDEHRNCQDVLITENGHSNEPVIGWVTNITITRHAKF